VIAGIAMICLLPTALAVTIVQENGPVENLSALGYFIAAPWLFWETWLLRIRDGFSAGFLIALLGLRELDFNSRFTTMGIFKTRYFISPKVPGGEKLIVTAILLVIFVIAIRYFRRNIFAFLEALRLRRMYAVSLVCSAFCIVASKILDSFSGPIEPLVACFSSEPRIVLQISEETIELAIPIYLLLAVYWYICLSGKDKESGNAI
jgi:hypothetical protein